ARKIDGPSGFFLATDVGDAAHFAARRGEGTVLDISLSKGAVEQLSDAGAKFGDIARGKRFDPAGSELVIPPEAFDLFNRLRDAGEIVIRPGTP
ncbi:MAG: hypothetical protein AAGN66_27440, partial [Acidobacteriota bacterium]